MEARVPEAEFQERIEALLDLIRERQIILGVADAVMSEDEVECVRWIAGRVEEVEP